MTGISTLREDLFAVLVIHGLIAVSFVHLIWRVVGVNHVWAVIFVVRLALRALHTSLHLGTNSNAVTDFTSCDF